MIHWARTTGSPVENIVSCSFVSLDLNSGDGRTDGRTICEKKIIPSGRDYGLAEWINKEVNTKCSPEKNQHQKSPHYKLVLYVLQFKVVHQS